MEESRSVEEELRCVYVNEYFGFIEAICLEFGLRVSG